jgi:CheY-like chemotaxis protein
MAKIMVVDDDEDIRLSVRSILEATGYQVVLARDGDECLRLVKKEKPDLILMDLLMNGTPVKEILPKLKNIKVIIFSVILLAEKNVSETGDPIPRVKDHPNIVDYINKPFELKDLLSKIKKALR